MSKATFPIYEARVGALGSVTFFRDPETNAYYFMFFNGEDYTPLSISDEAAYYVWAFIGCEHPEATITPRVAMALNCAIKKNFTSAKKAGRSKPKKKQPSKPIKKKAKSK